MRSKFLTPLVLLTVATGCATVQTDPIADIVARDVAPEPAPVPVLVKADPIPAPEPVVEAEPKAHPKAVEVLLACVCQTHPQKTLCMEDKDRRGRVEDAAVTFATLAQKHRLPTFAQPILGAVACGESGLNAAPTCGADTACVDECIVDNGWTPSDITPARYHTCTTKCGGTSGCNDSGTSAGMFQIKWNGTLGKLARKQGVDLYNPAEAAEFYLGRLLGAVRPERGAYTAKQIRGDCGKLSGWRLWSVALYRLGRGPTVQHSVTRKVYDLRSGEEREVTTERIPRCSANSKYARWAAAWAKRARGAWLPYSSEAVASGG